jgi:outer membrane protein assembly factor BamB
MSRYTRRGALAAGGAALAGLAGCISRPSEGETATTGTSTTAETTTGTTDEASDEATDDGTTTDDGPAAAWTRDLQVTSGIAVRDDTTFFGDASGRVHAMDPDGTDRWALDLEAPVRRLRFAADTIYAMTGSWSGPHLSGSTVHAIEPDGSARRWTHTVEKGQRTAVLLGEAEGVLGVGLRNDYIQPSGEATFGLDAGDGTEVWRTETGDVNEGAAGPETLYAGHYEGVTAFDPATGEQRWTHQMNYADAPILLSGVPVMADDDVVARDPATGDLRWTYGEGTDLAGAHAAHGRVYARGGVIAALDAEGTELWRYEKGGWVNGHTQRYLFGDDEARIFVLSTNGEEVWSADSPGEHFSLAAGTDAIVAGTWEGSVYAYDIANGDQVYSFDVEADHAEQLAATRNHILVTDETTLYALEG